MSIANPDLSLPTWPRPATETVNRHYWPSIQDRLNQMSEQAYPVEFDDTSRFVFFSDCHRSDRGYTDLFAPNEALFLYALEQYNRGGFTYIEAGDGDELWQNRHFQTVHRAYPRVFDLLHRLDQSGRLYLLLGNHDIQDHRIRQMHKDGLPVRECLRLVHAKTRQEILVFHGHQADPSSDRFAAISRLTVRTVWRQMLRLRLARGIVWGEDLSQRHALEKCIIDHVQAGKLRIEQRLIEWTHRKGLVVICGHTHHPVGARYGMTPYFNTGCCVNPHQITGLEIENGAIAQVRWTIDGGHVRRELVAAPRQLHRFN